jgi:Icc-related predicted phosphoesterase
MEKSLKKGLRILAAADFQGSSAVAESLAKKAEKEKVDLVILAGDIHGLHPARNLIAPFTKRNQKVIFVPGNWDTTVESNMIKDIYKINNIDGNYTHYNGVDIIGIGSPDSSLDIDTEKNLDKLIKNFEKVKHKDSKKVLVSHIHARNTLAEFSGIAGSEILRHVIDYFQPDIFISSHIHEAEGLEQKIGKTKVFQVGKKGKIIQID